MKKTEATTIVMNKVKTMQLNGRSEYAKVADRLKLFREENPRGKQESSYEVISDGSLVFTVWLWKSKDDLMELMKSGITDKDTLRSSADANGTAQGKIDAKKEKDFEKLESIALGRALANLGYLASGEIASSEEMARFLEYQDEKKQDAIAMLKSAKTIAELKELFMSLGSLISDKDVVVAKDKRKAELNENS